MKEYTGKIYRCDHCSKRSWNKGAMTIHERNCISNPNNKPLCDSCKHVNYKTEVLESENCRNEDNYNLNYQTCMVTGNDYVPEKKLNMNNWIGDIIRGSYFPIPSETAGCQHYEEKGFEKIDADLEEETIDALEKILIESSLQLDLRGKNLQKGA
jgi:hypothetical protein